MTITQRDAQHVFEKLVQGLVPERSMETFAVGVEKPRQEIVRQLGIAGGGDGEGVIKFLRGGYGCGKTFMARLAILDAQAQGFATSFVVVSDNDLRFHRFDEVYRKVVTELATASCPRGALGDILDRWIGKIEDAMIAAGEDADAPDFDAKVRKRLDDDLAQKTGGKAPTDFVRVIQTIFDLKQRGQLGDANSLISWLSGSGNIAASVKKLAGIKGDIGSSEAMAYLRGVLEIVKAAGYKGTVIVIDEAETILRMRTDSRNKSLNGIRQIADTAGSYSGLFWLFTGTPDFFDSRKGVAGLAPLHDRIGFMKTGNHVSMRQAQIELSPFDAGRLRAVALRLRQLYQDHIASDPALLMQRISDAFIDQLVAQVTAGFKGDVGVVPRQFLRALVNQMNLVDEDPSYDPIRAFAFRPSELNAQESHALTGEALGPSDDDENEGGLVPVEDTF